MVLPLTPITSLMAGGTLARRLRLNINHSGFLVLITLMGEIFSACVCVCVCWGGIEGKNCFCCFLTTTDYFQINVFVWHLLLSL